MKYGFAALAFAAGAAAGAMGGNGTVVYTTDVVTAYTTFCPEATVVAVGTSKYTVTASQTLIITDCPCTITRSVMSYGGQSTPAPYPTLKSTHSMPVYSTGAASPTGTMTPPVPFQGAANAKEIGVALVGAVAGFAALAL